MSVSTNPEPAPERPAVEIIIADTSELFDQCMAVRLKVFCDEQGFSAEDEPDQYDEPGRSVHFLMRLVPSREPIGTIRLVVNPRKLGRLAILPAYRKYKFGAALVLKTHEWVLNAPPETGGEDPYEIICHSQLYVKPFYAKYGYVAEGPEFDEDGAPHQRMRVKLMN